MREPSRGGEKRTAVWASHPEERGRDDVAAPPVCAPRGVPHCWVVLDRCNPAGSVAAAGPEAAARGEGLRVRRMTYGGRAAGPAWVAQDLANYCATSCWIRPRSCPQLLTTAEVTSKDTVGLMESGHRPVPQSLEKHIAALQGIREVKTLVDTQMGTPSLGVG